MARKWFGSGKAAAGALAVLVAGSPLIGPALPGFAAGPGATPVPTAARAMPPQVEKPSPYLPQKSCDPDAKPGVKAFQELVLKTWGRGYSGGVIRDCTRGGLSEHKEGRAWDWFVDLGKQGDQDAAIRTLNWLLMYEAENARRVGIMYIIWLRHIWSSYRHEDGWRRYSGPNPHTDHVHFSFSWAGANKRTSWWTGEVAGVDRGPRRLSALSVDRLDALPLDLLDTEAC